MSEWVNWSVFDFGTCRVFAKTVITVPVLRWSVGSGNEPAAAIGADVARRSINKEPTLGCRPEGRAHNYSVQRRPLHRGIISAEADCSDTSCSFGSRVGAVLRQLSPEPAM
jgi:hypothetical protein